MFGTTLRFGPRASGSRRLALPPPTKRWSGSTIASKASSALDTSLRHALLPIFSRWWSPHATSIDKPSAKRPWESSMCGNRAPSKNTAEPTPVPRVITSSMPVPVTTAQPCTSASFATRVGRPKRCCRASSSSKPFHAATSSPSGLSPGPRRENAGTSRTRPRRIAPGNPTDTRSYSGWVFASLSSSSSSTGGGHGYGVSTRTRSEIISPSGSRTTAFSPVPPTSTASVRGPLSPMTVPSPARPSRRDASRGHRPCHPRAVGSAACARIVDRPSPVRVGRRCHDRGANRGPVEEAP